MTGRLLQHVHHDPPKTDVLSIGGLLGADGIQRANGVPPQPDEGRKGRLRIATLFSQASCRSLGIVADPFM